MIKDFFSLASRFTWSIETSVSSVFLFGEYPYPNKEDFD